MKHRIDEQLDGEGWCDTTNYLPNEVTAYLMDDKGLIVLRLSGPTTSTVTTVALTADGWHTVIDTITAVLNAAAKDPAA